MVRPWIAGSLVAAAVVVVMPSAAIARQSVATLSLKITPVTKAAPLPGKFFTVRVNVLNQGPDALLGGGELILKLPNDVTDYAITRRRGVESCRLSTRGNATCNLGRLGVLDSAEVLVRLRVPASLGGKLLRVIAAAGGSGAKTDGALFQRRVVKRKPRPALAGGIWHGDWKMVAVEDPPPKGNGTTFAPPSVFSVTQRATTLCATYPWNPFADGRLGTGHAELTSSRAAEVSWTFVDGAGTTVWDARMILTTKLSGRYVFTPRSGKPIEGRLEGTKVDGDPLRIAPGC